MDVTSYFSSFSKKIDGWSDASREIGAVQAMPGLSFFRDKLIQAPENCSLSDIRSWLDAFEGFKEPSVWATHPLTPEERPTAFELIESECPKAYAQFVMDFRYLTFRESELEKTGKIAAYAGWKQDADAPKGSHFFQIRIDCKPPASKAVFMASCWRYLFDQAGIGREFAIETENDSWLAYPLGKLRPRTTEGPFQRKDDPRCTNAWGIEVLALTTWQLHEIALNVSPMLVNASERSSPPRFDRPTIQRFTPITTGSGLVGRPTLAFRSVRKMQRPCEMV